MTGIAFTLFHQHLNDITRRQAFLIHLGISLAIFIAFAILLIFFWYPGPLFNLEGGWKGIRIVALVDVVLGPALTLLVFKPGKPGLKFDMSLIIVVQAAALSWGIWTVSQARPALIVFADDAFYSITLSKLKHTGIPPETHDRLVGFSPSWVYTNLPEDTVKKADLITNAEKEGKEWPLFFELYTPLKQNLEKVLSKQLPIFHYIKLLKKPFQKKPHDYIRNLNKPTEDLAFFPLYAGQGKGIIILEKKTGQMVGFVDISYDPISGEKSRRMAKQEKNSKNGSP